MFVTDFPWVTTMFFSYSDWGKHGIVVRDFE